MKVIMCTVDQAQLRSLAANLPRRKVLRPSPRLRLRLRLRRRLAQGADLRVEEDSQDKTHQNLPNQTRLQRKMLNLSQALVARRAN